MTRKRTDGDDLLAEPTMEERTHRVRVFSVEIDREAVKAREQAKADRQAKRAARAAQRAAGATDADGDTDVGVDGDDDDDLLPVALSSEYPVRRYDWWDDEEYNEVLDHAAASIDLSRAADGLPFLDSHITRDGDAHIGRIVNVRVGSDKKLRGDIRFSQRQKAQEYRQDYVDGIRREVSIGYLIDPASIQISKEKDQLTEYRIMRWTPYEGSGVSVPADPTVGVGRSADEAARRRAPAILVTAQTARAAKEHTVDPNEKDPAAGGAAKDRQLTGVVQNDNGRAGWVGSNEEKAERDRVDTILTLAGVHGITFAENDGRLRKWIAEGRTVESVKAELLDVVKDRAKGDQAVQRPAVELTDKERKQYSLQRAILHMCDEIDNPRRASREGSFEIDIMQELEKKFPAGGGIKRNGGMLIPTYTRRETILELQYGLPYGSLSRAGLDSATATKGSELKFTVPGEFLPVLRNFMAVTKAGATFLGGLQGPIAFPKQSAAGTASWQGENPGVDAAESNLLLTQVLLSPKSLMSTTSYSRQLVAQSVIDVNGMVTQDLAAISALALDLAGIAGTGAANQPTGVLSTSGIGSVAMGTNGGTPTYPSLVDLETQVTAANADQWPLSYMVHPTTRGTFKKATVLSNNVGLPVWQKADLAQYSPDFVQGPNARIPGELNGYTAWASSQVPNNLTKGTSAGICLAILFGAWSQLVIGDWGMYELIVDPYRLKKQGMVELTSFGMYGLAVKYASAFAAIQDALA